MGSEMCIRDRASTHSMPDHLKLVWIFLGDQYLRSHEGHAYYYDHALGHFTIFAGLLPYHHFDYLRQVSLHLEGLFRSFGGNVKRGDAAVLAAVAKTFNQQHKSTKDILHELMENALYNKGNELLKDAVRRRGGKVVGRIRAREMTH